ncbi:hypothetical protein MKX01_032671 [Papaver californicum]|nr:hypothetical protein MKX01_032671 [Papaver californicum]
MGIYSSLRKGIGNTLVSIIYGNCFKPTTTSDVDDDDHHDYSNVSSPHQPPPTNSVKALGSDLFDFENNCEVPELLSEHVASSKKAQAKWYKKILKAWKAEKPPPKTPEQASRLVIKTLHQHQKADVEGLLKFYGLPVLDEHQIDIPAEEVDAYAVADGDGLTVYVDVADPREATISVPEDVQVAVSERSKARASKDYPKAKALHKTIFDAGYRFLLIPNWGIDAPEKKQPFGKEAKEELTKLVQGSCVIVHVYNEDKYNRHVGDVYCKKKFAQEVMLKKGLAWHYAAFDKRPELKKWANEAKTAGIGLWASSNPEKPWEWRKNNNRDGS